MVEHTEVLIELIKKHNIKIMAEVGVFKSKSLKWVMKSEVGKNIEQYWAIDQWSVLRDIFGRRLRGISQERWDSWYRKACYCMPWFPQLRVVRMTSEEASKLFPLSHFKGYFDFVYIDASHFYEDVVNDIKCWLPLVKKGGLLGGHDYGIGKAYSYGVVRAVREFFSDSEIELYEDRVWIKQL